MNNGTIGTIGFDDGVGHTGSVTAYIAQFHVTFTGTTGTPLTFNTFCIDLFHDVSVGQTSAVNARNDLDTFFANGSRMAAIFRAFGSQDLSANPDQAAAVQLALWDLSLNSQDLTPFTLEGGSYVSRGKVGADGVSVLSVALGADAAHIAAMANFYLNQSLNSTAQGAWFDTAAQGYAANRGQSVLVPVC